MLIEFDYDNNLVSRSPHRRAARRALGLLGDEGDGAEAHLFRDGPRSGLRKEKMQELDPFVFFLRSSRKCWGSGSGCFWRSRLSGSGSFIYALVRDRGCAPGASWLPSSSVSWRLCCPVLHVVDHQLIHRQCRRRDRRGARAGDLGRRVPRRNHPELWPYEPGEQSAPHVPAAAGMPAGRQVA